MKSHFASTRLFELLALAASVALIGCGGGGDSSGGTAGTPVTPPATTPQATAIPATGTFALVFKAEGPISAPLFGISLIHPADRFSEYMIEPPARNVSSPITLFSGTVDANNSKVSNLTAHSMLYIAGGDVKRLPLAATGASPKAALQVAGVTNLCDLVVDDFYKPQGADYATPLASKYLATTRGADNVCATADDGQVEISFDAQGKPMTAALPNAAALGPVLAVLRNPTTLKPSATVHARAIAVSQPTAAVITLAAATAPAMTKVLDVSVDALVGEQNNRLVFWDISGRNVALDSTITAGTGWERIGFDANNFYFFRNTGVLTTLPTSAWKIVKISRTSPAATLMASGAGIIQAASLGLNSIFITSANVSGFSLNRLAKAAPASSGTPVLLQGPSSTQIPLTLASNAGLQLVLTTSQINGSRNLAISVMEEETGRTLYSTANGFPLGLISDTTTLALNQSSGSGGFVFLANVSATAGALGATLTSFSAPTRTPIVVGQLPSASEFGSTAALAGPGGSTLNGVGTGTLSGLTAATILASPRRVFSFDPQTSNSIQYTTSVK